MFLLTYLRSFKFSVVQVKKLDWLISCVTVTLVVAMASCAPIKRLASYPDSQISQASISIHQLKSDEWRLMTAEEQEQVWSYILNSPLGIAALNQLAIEGFISPNCPKTFYVSQQYGGFQTLLQVKCNDARGISIASSYEEMRVTFERFEDNIENFQIERIYLSE